MTAPTPDPPSLRDWGTSWIRTAVPVLWGWLLTFLATRAPEVHELLVGNPAVLTVAVGTVTLAWYALIRRVEHLLPAWLTRLVIGANTAPQYVPGAVPHSSRVEEFDAHPGAPGA